MRERIASEEDEASGSGVPPRVGRHAQAARHSASPLLQIGLTPRLLTPPQAAAYCGMSLNHWNAHFRARLCLIPFGRRVLVDRKRLDELLDQLSDTTALSSPGEDLLAARLRAAATGAAARKTKTERA